MGEFVVVWDSLVLHTSLDANVGVWWFETVVAGTEWDPVLFKIISTDCRPKLQQSLSRHLTSPAFSQMHAEITELSLFRKDK